MSDVVYKVNCGRGGADQEVHCDRLIKAKPQVITRKYLSSEPVIETNELSSEEEDTIQDEEPEADNVGKHKRVRKRPFWTKDYVFYLLAGQLCQTLNRPQENKQSKSAWKVMIVQKQLNALSVKVHSMLEVTM